MLLTMCWCQQRFVKATRQEVQRSHTRTCGNTGCHPAGLDPDAADAYTTGAVAGAQAARFLTERTTAWRG